MKQPGQHQADHGERDRVGGAVVGILRRGNRGEFWSRRRRTLAIAIASNSNTPWSFIGLRITAHDCAVALRNTGHKAMKKTSAPQSSRSAAPARGRNSGMMAVT
jgi:hypothetical protein